MERNEFTPENRFRWISRMYFSVSDSPTHDVNPFDDIPAFLDAKVSDLSWGNDAAKSKEKFCNQLMSIFDLYDFKIPKQEVLSCLQKDSMKNKEVVIHLANVGTFPKN